MLLHSPSRSLFLSVNSILMAQMSWESILCLGAISHFQNLTHSHRTRKQDNDKRKCFSIANFLRFIRGAGNTTSLKTEQTEKQCSFAVPTFTLNIAIIKTYYYINQIVIYLETLIHVCYI